MKLGINILAKHELIGLEAEVIGSKNKSNIGVSGKIIEETKNTLVIEHKGKRKRLFKNNITLKITINSQQLEIEGEQLSGRPKDRIKQ